MKYIYFLQEFGSECFLLFYPLTNMPIDKILEEEINDEIRKLQFLVKDVILDDEKTKRFVDGLLKKANHSEHKMAGKIIALTDLKSRIPQIKERIEKEMEKSERFNQEWAVNDATSKLQ